MALKMTRDNVDYRTSVPELSRGLTDVIASDQGYIRQNSFIEFYEQGLKMISGIKKNIKNKLMGLSEKMLLKKQSIIETVFDYLKHTRHRSFINAFVHIISTLVAYSLKKHKPSINLSYSVSASTLLSRIEVFCKSFVSSYR